MSPVRNFASKDSDNGISNGMRLKVFIILLFVFAFVVINQVVTLTLAEESQKRESLTEGETTDVIIKRLEAMEAALAQVAGSQLPLEVPETELIQKPEEEFDKAKMEITLPKSEIPPATEVPPAAEVPLAAESPKGKKSVTDIIFWLSGLTLVSGLGFLVWRRFRSVADKKTMSSEMARLKAELQEKNKLIEQQETIRKAVEEASLQKEKEYERMRLESEEKEKLLEQYEKVKDSFESLKEVLIKRGEVKELTTPQEKGKLWILGKSPERRRLPRLDLSRDYNRTIILRIESPDKSKSIKSFANNISSGGLCFETRKDFEEKEMINLRLFFFGDKVPMIKIKAEIIWKKAVLPVNYYGVSFASLEEKGEIELNRYIESKIVNGSTTLTIDTERSRGVK